MKMAVQAEGLSKSYPTAVSPAVDRVDLEVAQGEVCALLGHNGAGKSTLVRMLTTLSSPTGGRAQVCGYDVVREGQDVRRRIGLVGQEAAIDRVLTARQNLVMFARLHGMSPRRARARAGELIEQFELVQAADRPVREYSGGMRRKTDLAVALLTEPTVLFADEPTTGLDPQARHQLWRALRDLVDAGTSVVLTTQYLQEADELADTVVILRDGRVVAQGTPRDLKRLVGPPRMELREPTLEDVYLHLYAKEGA